MNNIDWSMLITKQMKEDYLSAIEFSIAVTEENTWKAGELELIADQLLAIEDDDPNRLPGTDREWRDYRIAVRAWKEGAAGFPKMENRPVAPQE